MKNESIGTRIGRLRDAKNLSQEQLAKALDVSREKVKSWENNERQIKAGDITKLADFFSVSADYILGRSDVASPSADVQAVCAFTKLSERSIQAIAYLQHSEIFSYNPINAFFSSKEVDVLFAWMDQTLKAAGEAKTSLYDGDLELFRFKSIDRFTALLDNISDYQSIKSEVDSKIKELIQKKLIQKETEGGEDVK